MIDAAQWGLLTVGFGLGLLHAFDADHIMAVSVMASRQPKLRQNLAYASRWSLGHGGILLLLGALATVAGIQLPDSVLTFFEALVGFLLIGLGGWLLLSVKQQRLKLAAHSHGGVWHVHLQSDQPHTDNSAHTPVMVGLVHGLAGSAPVLALLPAIQQGETLVAMAYLTLFGLGMLVSMTLFGYGLTHLQHRLLRWNQRLFQLSRQVLGCVAVAFGGYWLYAAA